MGIEPTSAGATIRCVHHFATAAIIFLAGAVGIEPTLEVLETSVLPLNYAPIKIKENLSLIYYYLNDKIKDNKHLRRSQQLF